MGGPLGASEEQSRRKGARLAMRGEGGALSGITCGSGKPLEGLRWGCPQRYVLLACFPVAVWTMHCRDTRQRVVRRI